MISRERLKLELIPNVIAFTIYILFILSILSYFHIIVFNLSVFSTSAGVSAILTLISNYLVSEVKSYVLYREPRDKFHYWLRKLHSSSLQIDEIIFGVSFMFREKSSYEDVEKIFKKLINSNEFKEVFERKNINLEKLYPDVDGLKLEGKIKGYSFKGDIVIIGNDKRNLAEKLQISLVAKSIKYKDIQEVLNSFWYAIDGGETDLFALLRDRLPIDSPKGERVIISIKNQPVALQYFSTLNVDKISAQKTVGKMIYNITISYNHNTKLGELYIEGPWGEIGKIVSEASLWYL